MDYNFHTHTVRCHHATGTDEEYVKRAIENGVKYMGFSDHAPFEHSNGHQSWYRINTAEVADYVNSIKVLREKYKDEISLFIGFEMEYYPNSFKKMLDTAIDCGAEYLILGQHFFEEEFDNSPGTSWQTQDVSLLKRYVSLVVEGMETGAFTYVAHPDMMYFDGDYDIYYDEMKKICIASKELDIPLEINFCGIRGKRSYPTDKFWKIAGEVQCPVVCGCDAHTAADAYDVASFEKAKEIIKRFNLNYIGKPNLIFISKK